jgi:hypothetical protein
MCVCARARVGEGVRQRLCVGVSARACSVTYPVHQAQAP